MVFIRESIFFSKLIVDHEPPYSSFFKAKPLINSSPNNWNAKLVFIFSKMIENFMHNSQIHASIIYILYIIIFFPGILNMINEDFNVCCTKLTILQESISETFLKVRKINYKRKKPFFMTWMYDITFHIKLFCLTYFKLFKQISVPCCSISSDHIKKQTTLFN